jgi:phenylacetate-CoA ligase
MTSRQPNAPADVLAPERDAFLAGLPAHCERLGWTSEQLRAHQDRALQALLRVAVSHSPFHADRLSGLVGDIDTFTIDDLSRLPVMTKAEMMARFDDVPTDRRVRKVIVDDFLAGVGAEPRVLLDRYVVLASGGSSGRRGVFVWPRESVPDFLATILRAGVAGAGLDRVPPNGVSIAMVAAGAAIHATRVCAALIDGAIGRVTVAPATLPIEEIVRRLNRAEPAILVAYAGMLRIVAEAQLAGHLTIRPRMILSTSEQLSPETAATVVAAFGVAPGNSFGSSEGLNGSAAPGTDTFTFASDGVHVEFVDEHDQAVTAGTPAHHVLVTNLLNTAQPLIR